MRTPLNPYSAFLCSTDCVVLRSPQPLGCPSRLGLASTGDEWGWVLSTLRGRSSARPTPLAPSSASESYLLQPRAPEAAPTPVSWTPAGLLASRQLQGQHEWFNGILSDTFLPLAHTSHCTRASWDQVPDKWLVFKPLSQALLPGKPRLDMLIGFLLTQRHEQPCLWSAAWRRPWDAEHCCPPPPREAHAHQSLTDNRYRVAQHSKASRDHSCCCLRPGPGRRPPPAPPRPQCPASWSLQTLSKTAGQATPLHRNYSSRSSKLENAQFPHDLSPSKKDFLETCSRLRWRRLANTKLLHSLELGQS